MLAPAFGQALPSLAGVPVSYSYEENAGTLIDFCRVLAERGIGDEATWIESGRRPLRFAAAAVKAALDRSCGELLKRNVNYDLSIQDALDGYHDEPLRDGSLVVSVECHGCGYLRIGPALAALEQEAEGLGAAFYHLLRLSLYRWLRLYDHTDAKAYSDNLREWAEQEREEASGEYEFPDIEGAMPAFLRAEDGLKLSDYRAMVRRHRKGPPRLWLESLLRLAALTRVPSRAPRNLVEDFWDDAPLPVLLICFNSNDAIEAAFDAEAESMHEASHEPTFLQLFSPSSASETDRAMRSVQRFVAINLELFTPVEALNQQKELTSHADPPLDRQQQELRAA